MLSSLYIESYIKELDIANIFSVVNNKEESRSMVGRGGLEIYIKKKKKKEKSPQHSLYLQILCKSLFHVLSHTIRIVNRENAQIHVASSIHLKKMEAISFKAE